MSEITMDQVREMMLRGCLVDAELGALIKKLKIEVWYEPYHAPPRYGVHISGVDYVYRRSLNDAVRAAIIRKLKISERGKS